MEARIQTQLDKLILESFELHYPKNGVHTSFSIKSRLSTYKRKYPSKYDKYAEEFMPLAIRLIEEEEEEAEREEEEKRQKERRLNEDEIRKRIEETERIEKVRFANQISPDALLILKDVKEIDAISVMDTKLVEKALEELNLEIIKRIVRQTYPHKF